MYYYQLTEMDVDGCGTDVNVIIGTNKEISQEDIDGVKNAVNNYKDECDYEWDSSGIFETVEEYLLNKGYSVQFINITDEIIF